VNRVGTQAPYVAQHDPTGLLTLQVQERLTGQIADTLISTKGVKHGRLTITTTGAEL